MWLSIRRARWRRRPTPRPHSFVYDGRMKRTLSPALLVFALLLAAPAWAGDVEDCTNAEALLETAPERAIAACRRLAEQGNAPAQYNLGVIYGDGLGVPQDYAEAVKWLRMAAEQGLAEGQVNLGVRYAKGEGVPQDYAEAMKWYRRAAEQNISLAQYNLGYMYDNGQGVPRDHAEAAKWYRLAAEQGYAWAQYNLGIMYGGGRGVQQDGVEAVRWFRAAAERGHATAQLQLGLIHAMGLELKDFVGLGVPKDYVEAHKWFSLAASGLPPGEDYDLAVESRDSIASLMTTAEIAEAERLAREWAAKHPQ